MFFTNLIPFFGWLFHVCLWACRLWITYKIHSFPFILFIYLFIFMGLQIQFEIYVDWYKHKNPVVDFFLE